MKDMNSGGIPPVYLHATHTSSHELLSPTLGDLFSKPRGGSRRSTMSDAVPTIIANEETAVSLGVEELSDAARR